WRYGWDKGKELAETKKRPVRPYRQASSSPARGPALAGAPAGARSARREGRRHSIADRSVKGDSSHATCILGPFVAVRVAGASQTHTSSPGVAGRTAGRSGPDGCDAAVFRRPRLRG